MTTKKDGRLIKQYLFIILGVQGFLWCSLAQARPVEEAGTSAAVMLAQPASSRLLAMGTAGVAAAIGQEGLWWNPAALARHPAFNAEFSYRRHWTDTELGFFGVAVPTPYGVPSLGLIFSETKNIAGYDLDDNPTELFSTIDMDLKFGYALKIGPVGLGFAMDYLYQDFHTSQTHGLGGDFGVDWEFRPGLRVAASLLHFGRTVAGDPLSQEIRGGVSAQVSPNVLLAYDFVIPRDSELYLAGGVEWNPFGILSLRAGWRNGPGSLSQRGGLVGLSAGAGLAWNNLYLDYAFEPAGFLSDVHHVSFGYRFQPEPTPEPTPFVPAPPREAEQEILEAKPFEGRMEFIPRVSQKDFEVKEFTFKVKDAEGTVVRTFSFMGAALPRKMVWDGKDDQGRQVAQSDFSFDFEYVTDTGVKTEQQAWPQVEPAGKLWFLEDGLGVSPEVELRLKGKRNLVKAWRVQIIDQVSGEPIRAIYGKGKLPEKLTWDGKDTARRWAPPEHTYAYELRLTGVTGAKVVWKHDIVPIPAQEVSRDRSRVTFRILEIIFGFNEIFIRPNMEMKIAKAIEIQKRHARQARLQIQGHADEVGTRWVNYNISRNRALKVLAYMRQHGIPFRWGVDAVGYGKDKIVARSEDEERRSQNRRVEIQIELPAPRKPAKSGRKR